VAGADLRAALVASCLRGALPPVDLRAVCLVRAILRSFVERNCVVSQNSFLEESFFLPSQDFVHLQETEN
jgi:hypothetical protein